MQKTLLQDVQYMARGSDVSNKCIKDLSFFSEMDLQLSLRDDINYKDPEISIIWDL